MVWGCFANSGPGQLAMNSLLKMNSQVYQGILQENVRLSVRQFKLNRRLVMQPGNDPKHRSPDLNPIGMLWHDLKRPVHTRHPKNIAELKQFVKRNDPKFLLTVVPI